MRDCDEVQTSTLMSLKEALAGILSEAQCQLESEPLPLPRCLDRVLAEKQISTFNVPPADNSAMDGYAVRVEDLATDGSTRLRVSQRIAAGESGLPLHRGTAARIFTGAPIPAKANAVVMQEVCREDGPDVLIPAGITDGANIRRAGEDIRAGTAILQPGRRLRPQDLGLAASVGLPTLPVYRKLRVAILTTGDELRDPGESLAPGQIYNSNRYTLRGLLESLGCEVSDIGQVADTLHSTRSALSEAARNADLIISCGGVSVGEEDHVRDAVRALGEISVWRIAIKPGKPCVVGQVEGVPFLGLPGNPVSTFVTFALLARPYILKLQGAAYQPPREFLVTADFAWPKAGKRLEFLRARLERREGGQLEAVLYPNNSSGVLTSAVWADGLVVMPIGQTVKPGDKVQYIPLDSLLHG